MPHHSTAAAPEASTDIDRPAKGLPTGTHPSPKDPETADVIDRMYDALSRGSIEDARACCTAEMVTWHNFDQVAAPLDDVVVGWQQLVENFAERSFVDVRRAPLPGGWVQRHLMVVSTASGTRTAWPICLFVTLQDGLIARIDEYIDRAGRCEAIEDPPVTPGLPATEPAGAR